MGVQFNVEAEPDFLDTLEYLGETAVEDVLEELARIESQNLSWEDFVADHGWAPVELLSHDTYPGADPLYWFAIVGKSGTRYQVAAKGPFGTLVICSAVAQ